jgi:hypothetical protein
MPEQFELFPAVEYVDLSHGMTARSTRSKTPPNAKRRSPRPSNDRLYIQNHYELRNP